MRDFYDIHILMNLYGNKIHKMIFRDALLATFQKRGSDIHLKDAKEIIHEVQTDINMKKMWKSYQHKYTYASSILWDEVIKSVYSLYDLYAESLEL